MSDTRPITRAQVDEVAAVLGRAFVDNPAYRAILASFSDEARLRAVERIKRGFTRAAVDHQVAEAIHRDGRIAGASLVCDPGQYPPTLLAKIRQASGCATLGPRAIRNLLVIDSVMSKRHLKEPHFYLFVLGVDPAFQGRGIGKALLHRLNARADAAGRPCFLETDKETSVRLYESVGYEVVGEERVAKLDGARFWFMKRATRRGVQRSPTDAI